MFLVSRICIKKARTSNGCSLHQTSKLDIPSLQIKRYTGAFTRNRALLGFSRSNMASTLETPVSEMTDFSLSLKLQSYMGLEHDRVFMLHYCHLLQPLSEAPVNWLDGAFVLPIQLVQVLLE
jgi:hypothetical protein